MPAIESRATEAALPPAPTGTAAAAPRIWLLLDDRPGHITQVVGLAEALGWPYETKALRFTPLNRLSNRLLGASRLSLDPARPTALTQIGRASCGGRVGQYGVLAVVAGL